MMGVPISFLDKYNPDQFEIIGTTDRKGEGRLDAIKKEHAEHRYPFVKGKAIYKRLIIKHRPKEV